MDFVKKMKYSGKEDEMLSIELRRPNKKDFDKIKDAVDVDKFKKVLKQHAKDLKKHFNEDGWDIDADGTDGYVLYDLLGFHISEFIRASLMPKDVYITYIDGRAVYRKEDYEPVYLDKVTGEIVIGRIDKKELICGDLTLLGQL